MTKWRETWASGARLKSTSEVIYRNLCENDGGVAERAERMADNVADALGRLAEALENKGLFTTDEIKTIFQIYGFEPVEDEA